MGILFLVLFLVLPVALAVAGIAQARRRPEQALLWFLIPFALALLMPWILAAFDPWLNIYTMHRVGIAPQLEHRVVGPSWHWLLWAYPLMILLLGAAIVRKAPDNPAAAVLFTFSAAILSLLVSIATVVNWAF